MRSRLELQDLLESIAGSQNVYFQPPASVQMRYPAIRYARESMDFRHADDGVYSSFKRYSVIVIDKNPDSNIVDKMATLPMCRHDRHYKQDNLNHDVFTLYF